VNLVALTPRTSMTCGALEETFQERAAAFAALRTILGRSSAPGVGIARIFAGTVGAAGHASPRKRLRALATEWGDLDRKAAKIFRQAVEAVDRHRQQEGRPKLDAELHALARLLPAHARFRTTGTSVRCSSGRCAKRWPGPECNFFNRTW